MHPVPAIDDGSGLSFFLVAEGQPTVTGHTGVGGRTTSDSVCWAMLRIQGGPDALARGVHYRVEPSNSSPPYKWIVPAGFSVRRD